MPHRATRFTYLGLATESHAVIGTYDLDGTVFRERVDFDHAVDLSLPGVRAAATLWYLVAGLSYYKAGAAATIDLAGTPLGPAGMAFVEAAVRDGLGEFAYRNGLDLTDVHIVGAGAPTIESVHLDASRVLVPFGGGIDSIVTVSHLATALEQTLFIVSPASGRFVPLDDAADAMALPILRVTRELDPHITTPRPEWFNGHVPVTAMVTLLATIAAIGTGRGGVVMSNEHSASVPNTTWQGRPVNHQWSKSFDAEVMLASALDEALRGAPTVASFLRDRSEPWVARELVKQPALLSKFRSCNRAFRQDPTQRAATWCGECDKCLFIALMLAPFLPRAELTAIFGGREPLLDPSLHEARVTLVGLGTAVKPFECVGDPVECAATWRHLATLPEWAHEDEVRRLNEQITLDAPFAPLFNPQGPSRVPAHWLS